MKFNLTKNQIKILAANDPAFLDVLINRIESGHESVEAAAKFFIEENGNNKIAAIKALRQWASDNRDLAQSEGFDGSLYASKVMVEKFSAY
jgi:hypothetical protein